MGCIASPPISRFNGFGRPKGFLRRVRMPMERSHGHLGWGQTPNLLSVSRDTYHKHIGSCTTRSSHTHMEPWMCWFDVCAQCSPEDVQCSSVSVARQMMPNQIVSWTSSTCCADPVRPRYRRILGAMFVRGLPASLPSVPTDRPGLRQKRVAPRFQGSNKDTYGYLDSEVRETPVVTTHLAGA